MTAPTLPICERLRYVAAILDANVNKFTVPDHIPVKARSVREAADTIEALYDALEWYREQVEGCRKLGSIGDPFRHALDADGGKRAERALTLAREGAPNDKQ